MKRYRAYACFLMVSVFLRLCCADLEYNRAIIAIQNGTVHEIIAEFWGIGRIAKYSQDTSNKKEATSYERVEGRFSVRIKSNTELQLGKTVSVNKKRVDGTICLMEDHHYATSVLIVRIGDIKHNASIRSEAIYLNPFEPDSDGQERFPLLRTLMVTKKKAGAGYVLNIEKAVEDKGFYWVSEDLYS